MVLNVQNNICSFKIPLHIILFLRFSFFSPLFPYKVLPQNICKEKAREKNLYDF